jgi:Cof subfamily protein (haloacid dehalogenase superfamily)
MSYRLLAIDLDGTLLTRHKRILPRTRGALDAAAGLGCRVVIATGRSYAVARYFCDGLTLSAPQITYNGAVIHDPAQSRDLCQYLVPPVYVKPGVDFFMEASVPVALFTPQTLYLDRRIPRPQAWLPGRSGVLELIPDVRAVATQPCIKVVGHSDPLTIATVRPLAVERFGHALYVTQTSSELLELLHPEVSKGAALRRIAHMLGVARDEVIAFGDSHNDLDMLEFAGVGVAMGNASAEVKALADLITDSNEDDGIATALERLGVI